VPALAGWENFYGIVGLSAGALIGLQFVVTALVANLPRTPGQTRLATRLQSPPLFISELSCCSQLF
jgi:hypothetical protein